MAAVAQALPGLFWEFLKEELAYDEASARMLEQMADWIGNQTPGIRTGRIQTDELKGRLHETEVEASRALPPGQAAGFPMFVLPGGKL